MNDPPQLLRPNRLSWGASPTRHRVSDDILANLTPPTAVDALTSPTGLLRGCLDVAPASDREFAMQTAVASKSIWEWLDELTDWTWPTEAGPAGFESPSYEQGNPFVRVTAPEGINDKYVGSLLAEDVSRYESRIEQIHRDLETLNVEEIKRCVLANHIMPLSRPGTPASISSRSGMPTAPNYNKMEDLSAVVTAIVVQALPNLARLSRLLQVWTIRLSVLQRVPPLLLALEDAETAMTSGWHAVSLSQKTTHVDNKREPPRESKLTREHFEVMRRVLAKKVSAPGRTLDYMLDCLEGLQDTLPDKWLDRMEAVERDYAEWVASCEQKIRASDWGRKSNMREGSSPERTEPPPADMKVELAQNPQALAGLNTSGPSTKNTPLSSGPELDSSVLEGERGNISVASFADSSMGLLTDDGNESDAETLENSTWSRLEEAPTFEQTMSPVMERDELELPPLRDDKRRLRSGPTPSSLIAHGASDAFDDESSDGPEVSASPSVPRSRIREAKYMGDSPPSSPPLPQEETRESSVGLLDSPVITSIPENESFATSTVEGSFTEDFDDSFSVISDVTRPNSRRESSGDQQLRQQISQIIESIPAKIKLSSEAPKVNLNPPDLQLPRLKKKPSKEPFKRSASSLSSRTATPSFTLSPAKTSRPRHARGQQEIKVYHLSRSTGEPPIKLFIRCVGEHGERVMVRVGGGWADLSEYLKEYATHHKRRSGATENSKVEIRDIPRVSTSIAANSSVVIDTESSPPSRPGSVVGDHPPLTPLNVRKTRRSTGAANSEVPRLQPKTPSAMRPSDAAPSSEDSTRSRSSSRLSWVEGDSSFLGLAGPSGKKVEMSDENKAWVESVKEKVRLASGERTAPETKPTKPEEKRFGELGKVGGTKRLFRKKNNRTEAKK